MGLLDFAFDDTFTPAPKSANPFQTPFVPMTGTAPAPMGVMPSVLPRRRPSVAAMSGFTPIPMPEGAATAMQGRPNPVFAMPTPSVMSMPSVLPKSKPQMQGPMPAPTPMGAPDFVTAMPQAKLVTPQQMAPQGGLLGNMFDADINSAKARGILGASAALLDAGGPRVGAPAPSLGQAIGGAITQGLGAYDAQLATEQALKSQAITDRYKQAQAAQMEAAATRPIIEDLGDGAFSRVTDPVTGEIKIVENTKVKEYLEDKLKAKAKAKDVNVRLDSKQAEKQVEDLSDIDTKRDLVSQMDNFIDLINDGQLDFGLLEGARDSFTLSGYGPTATEADKIEARNSQSFDRFVSSLRNSLLTLQKGVQTEGDAERIKNEILTGLEARDKESVLQALKELKQKQNQSIRRLKNQINNRRKEAGASAYEFAPTAEDISIEIVED